MKKLILTMVLVFATGLVTKIDASNLFDAGLSCVEQAWRYGTHRGNGDPEREYYWTNYYYNNHCVNE